MRFLAISEHSKLLGSSDAFLDVLDKLSLIAPLNRPLLVVGERGTGKELIAERAHYLSGRWSKPFIKLNCAAITPTLLESELFGHEAGAFTGATKRHIGRFERADGGTLFLDELGTLSAAAQEKLLRVIEYGQFERVGGSQGVEVDVRVVAATNEDLPTVAREGRFRYDLLDRLSFDVLTLPPLRARKDDILILAEHFALRMCKELQRSFFPGFSSAAARALLDYLWPGNIRELKNVVERSVYRSEQEAEPVQEIVIDPFASPYRPHGSLTSPPHKSLAKSPESYSEQKTSLNADLGSEKLPLDWPKKRAEIEAQMLNRALEQAYFNQKNAADLLNLSYHQFRNLLKKHDLKISQDDDE